MPDTFDLEQSLFASSLGTAIISDSTELDTASTAKAENGKTSSKGTGSSVFDALNKSGASSSTQAQSMVFPDTLDDTDFMADEPSHGLTLLPTAVDSDDDMDMDDEDTGGIGNTFNQVDALLSRKLDDEAESSYRQSQFDTFSDARVVTDPETGTDLLQPASKDNSHHVETHLDLKLYKDLTEKAQRGDLQAANLSRTYMDKDSTGLHSSQRGNTEEQAREIAAIHHSKRIAKELGDRESLRDRGIAEFSATENYMAYMSAWGQAEKYKRQKTAHPADKGKEPANDGLDVSALPESFTTPSKAIESHEPQIDLYSSKHAFPPESGEFMSSRTSSGKALYFALRSEIDVAKKLDSLASLRGNARMSSSQVNRVVADIESDLDTALAIRASEIDSALQGDQDTDVVMQELGSQDNQDPKSQHRSKHRNDPLPSALWVDKYRARSFLDLVSDERVNRAVMQWLKEWDYCVFGRENALIKRAAGSHGSAGGDKQAAKSVDKWKRPQRRILLLSGPPGLGKTTLAHVAARQAGYSTVEINASDDRTVSKVRDRVLGVTQTHAVGMQGTKPQLLIIDEIDGAASASAHSSQGDFITTLVKLASAEDTGNADGKKAGGRRRSGKYGPLLRPVICICNNIYAPVLRPLRQIAQCYHVSPPTSARLAKRLEEVCEFEGIAANMWTLVELAKQNEGDIRSCLNSLQVISTRTKSLSSDSLQGDAIGVKDIQRSLFTIWGLIFTKPDTSSLSFSRSSRSSLGKRRGNLGDRSGGQGSIDKAYAEMILDSVRSSGEHERLMQGCFENYLRMDFRDLTHTKVTNLCTDWLEFYDTLDTACRKNPTVSDILYDYLPYPMLAVHRACSTPLGLSRGDFEYPHSEFEAFQGKQVAAGIIQSLISSAVSARARSACTVSSVAVGLIDPLLHILSPTLVTANKHLLKGEEKERLGRLLQVMSSWQLTFVQNKDVSGQFVYKLEPPIDRLFGFSGSRPSRTIIPMRYPVRQLISQELERLRIARIAAKEGSAPSSTATKSDGDSKEKAKREYLDKLFADPLAMVAEKAKQASQTDAGEGSGDTDNTGPVVRDFFGRIVKPKKKKTQENSRESPSKSLRRRSGNTFSKLDDQPTGTRAWFHFFEGFSNAVRKPTQMKELF